jgi:hypothetical protein
VIRLRVLIVLLVLLAGGAFLDRTERPQVRVRSDTATRPVMPIAGPAGALSSAWYCAGGTAKPDGVADGTVVIANPGPKPVTGAISVMPTEGDRKRVRFTVGAHARASLRYQDQVLANYAAALVEMDGGEVVVEHVVRGPLGESSAPCASAASDRWYFAEGSTAREDTMLLSLFNPFAEDAIVDLSFWTDEGLAVPGDFQGLVVRARSLNVVNVGDHVRRRDAVAATVSARSGRIVADRIQLRNTPPRRGLTLALGAPSAGDQWTFAEGFITEGVGERFHLYNPNDEEALVDLELLFEDEAVEPFEVPVPPKERVTIVTSDEERVPKGKAHAAIARTDGIGVVVERTLEARGGGRSGIADALGARQSAKRWVFAAGCPTETVDEWIVVQNTSGRDVTVSLTGLVNQRLGIADLQDVELPAGKRRAFRLGDKIRRTDLPLLVEATGPVVVERSLFRVNGLGISMSTGIPLRD